MRKDQEIAQHKQREEMRARVTAIQEKPLENGSKGMLSQMKRKWETCIQWLAFVLPGSHVLEASNGLLAYVSAAQLAVFYLFGRYYTIAHRLAKVDYVYASARRPNSRPQSYEVLGVLLATQLLVKLGMALHSSYQGFCERRNHEHARLANPSGLNERKTATRPANSVQIDDSYFSHADKTTVKHMKSTDDTIPLAYPDADAPASAERLGFGLVVKKEDRHYYETMLATSKVKTTQLEAIADEILRCTLCMDRRTPESGNSTVTECGHVFCWDCITGWVREKPECPLCRHALQANKLVPIYNL